MLRTLIKVTFGYPAIFDEVRQECQINNAHVVAGCGSGYQSVYSRCQSCRTSVRKSSGPRFVCRISGCKSTEFAQRHGREGIKLMGQKFFDMHESSRLNMSFNCSGAFNIIYIMRTMMMENGKQPPSVNQFIQPATSPGRRNEHTYRELRRLRNIVFAKRIKQML